MHEVSEIVHCCRELAATITQMCNLARSGQWSRLADLDARCTELSERMRGMDPDAPLHPMDRARLAALFTRIRADQQELSSLVRPQFTQLMRQVELLQRQQELGRAYRATSEGHGG